MNLSTLAAKLWPFLARLFMETGTWTPTLVGGGTAGTFTYDTSVTGGEYTRIGDRVVFNGRVRITVITVAPTGQLDIGGLPYTGDATNSNIAGGASFGGWTGITFTGARTQLGGDVVDTTAAIRLIESGSGLALAGVQGGALALVGGAADFRFAGSYRIA